MQATKELVTKFVQLGGPAQSAVLRDETYVKCQKSQTEVISPTALPPRRLIRAPSPYPVCSSPLPDRRAAQQTGRLRVAEGVIAGGAEHG